jgi:hypothetical protein
MAISCIFEHIIRMQAGIGLYKAALWPSDQFASFFLEADNFYVIRNDGSCRMTPDAVFSTKINYSMR